MEPLIKYGFPNRSESIEKMDGLIELLNWSANRCVSSLTSLLRSILASSIVSSIISLKASSFADLASAFVKSTTGAFFAALTDAGRFSIIFLSKL